MDDLEYALLEYEIVPDEETILLGDIEYKVDPAIHALITFLHNYDPEELTEFLEDMTETVH